MKTVNRSRIYTIHDPFRAPDWRLRRVDQIRQVQGKRARNDDDDDVKAYLKFRNRLMASASDPSSTKETLLYREDPGLFYAHQIYANRDLRPEVAFVIEARLLAGFSSREIGSRCGTLESTIDWYEKIFFNVRDRITCYDWVLNSIIVPSISAVPSIQAKNAVTKKYPSFSLPFYDSTLKYFAYFGGKVLCEFMLHGDKIGVQPNSYDELLDYMEDDFKHKFYRRAVAAVQSFDVTWSNVSEVFNTFTNIMTIRAATDDAETASSSYHTNVGSMLHDLTWNVGDAGKKAFANSKVGDYDDSAVELRADELLRIAAGRSDDKLLDLKELTINQSMTEVTALEKTKSK